MSCEFPGAVWSCGAGDQELGLNNVFLGVGFLQKVCVFEWQALKIISSWVFVDGGVKVSG